ncbi:MAG TPA: DoxX family protein [Rhizomicrobium sp.]|nr:DoxX family protein [Rhizomicrobium sp.]
MGFLDRFSYQILGITRIVAGLLFLEHGTTKHLNFPAGNMHPPLASLGGAAGVIEIITGVMIILGFFSRPAAFIASGTMAFAYWLAHAPRSPFPVHNGGDAAILFCFLFLYIAAAGPGAFSINKK